MTPPTRIPAPERSDVTATASALLSRSGTVLQTLPRSVLRRAHKERWSVYLLRNERNALYTGATNDLAKRVHEHKNKLAKGAKFTKACKSLELVYHCEVGPKVMALKIEAKIKKLKRPQKNALVAANPNLSQLLVLTATELGAKGTGRKDMKRQT